MHIKKYREPALWTAALLLLFLMNPSQEGFSFCVFRMAGFSSCPGCGIGHAIHYALRLDWQRSIEAHYAGIPATLGIVWMIARFFFNQNKSYIHGPAPNAPDVTRPATR